VKVTIVLCDVEMYFISCNGIAIEQQANNYISRKKSRRTSSLSFPQKSLDAPLTYEFVPEKRQMTEHTVHLYTVTAKHSLVSIS
jgi:hypothetical protein